MALRTYGTKLFEGDEWLEVGRGVGLREAQGLKDLVPAELSGSARLAEALKRSHWAVLEDAVVEEREGVVELGIYGCSAREALAKWGAKAYDCARFTKAVLEGLALGLGLRVEVELLRPPRRAGRGEESCRWRLKVLGEA